MKFLQKIALVCVVCLTVTSFGGCTLPWWNTSDWGSGSNNPYDPNSKSDSSVPLPGKTDDTYKSDDIDHSALDKAGLQKQALATQGVRSIYVPKVDETTTDSDLSADRAKYYENVAYQYEIIAKYILHVLQGKYGSAKGEETMTYEFYANSTSADFYTDKKIRNETDKTSITITLPSNEPKKSTGKLLDTHENAINAPVVNVKWVGKEVGTRENDLGEQNSTPGMPAVEPYKDSSLHWNISGTDITSYTSRVQLNLMQMALNFTNDLWKTGEAKISLTPINSSSATTQNEIKNLSRKIDKLGVPQKAEFRKQLIEYIEQTLIGEKPMAREDDEISYTDLSYVWKENEKTGTQNVGTADNPKWKDVYEWVDKGPAYYGMDSAHSFNSKTIYKFGYHDTVTDIVDNILGTYDSNGKITTTGFVADYPTYTRAEAVDSQPFNFYYNTDETLDKDAMQHIISMEAREYNSAVIYPDASIKLEEIEEYYNKKKEDETLEAPEDLYDYDFAKKRWLFDSLDIYIESQQEITIDIYMRIHLRGEKQADGTYAGSDYIVHLTRMNTDPQQEYTYYPVKEKDDKTTDSETKTEEEEVTPETELFNEEKTNFRYVMLSFGDLMDKAQYNQLVKGIDNQYIVDKDKKSDENYRQFFHEEQVLDEEGVNVVQEGDTYHNVFLGKLGSTVKVDTARHLERTLTAKNYWGDTVDFSDKYLCQDDCDFVEFIFDVKKDATKSDDYDYSFKYSIIPQFLWGEYAETEETTK